ncbi:MAG TPA: tRNA epoxyqueuosine(34) reductase QueG [Devosia sp.]|nr:tRNA epoxyqueuosine(34) reductase QueG [Devosia sp.]
MTAPPLRTQKLVALIKQRAQDLGFDAFGIVRADARPDLPQKLDNVLDRQWHAGMHWMEETRNRRAKPNSLWPQARSIIVLAMSYAPDKNPLSDLAQKSRGNISVYARNKDYHDLMKGRLKEVAGLLARKGQGEVKVFVDTAPVMEKPLGQQAGVGWQGKNTVLTSRSHGAWLFLGEIFTDLDLPPDLAHPQNCGSCTACLDICPTKAFPQPFVLDAGKCLAYYNNEHHGPIPEEFRKPMGNRIFGCDDCLAVCPWNKFAGRTREAKFHARAELNMPKLETLLRLGDAEFRKTFAGSPVKRLGHARFLRNVLIAAGNSADPNLLEPVRDRLADKNPLVRASAVWAARQLAATEQFVQWRKSYTLKESDPDVLAEWGNG